MQSEKLPIKIPRLYDEIRQLPSFAMQELLQCFSTSALASIIVFSADAIQHNCANEVDKDLN